MMLSSGDPPKLWVKSLTGLLVHLESRLKSCHNTMAIKQERQSERTAAGQARTGSLAMPRRGLVGRAAAVNTPGGHTWPRKRGGRERTTNRTRRGEPGRKKKSQVGPSRDKQRVMKRVRHVGVSQVPRPTLTSRHYPAEHSHACCFWPIKQA